MEGEAMVYIRRVFRRTLRRVFPGTNVAGKILY
jgi:hypothetical protein